MLNVDGWTDGQANERTNVRKLARLCLPAKAGATKMYKFVFASSYNYNIILCQPAGFSMLQLTQKISTFGNKI